VFDVKTLILFAHHDVGGDIDPHVIKYVEELRKLGDTTIVFVSDPARNKAINAAHLGVLTTLVDEFHSEHTPSRDFGSWRIAWDIAKHHDWIKDCDRVVFANDSVYAGLYPLKEMWESFTGADMYGAIESEEGDVNHFESFFLVFDMNEKTRPFLDKFWEDFEFIDDYYGLIRRYEIGMAERASGAGLTSKAFVTVADFKQSYFEAKLRPWDEVFTEDDTWGGGTWYFWYGLIHYHRFPFLKVKVARMKGQGQREVIERHTDYPFDLIENHVERVNGISWLTMRGDPRMTADKKSM
jgi:lipopolysaccharide biosynthesis protein